MDFSFHHVHVICSDLETTERFLIDMLGARFIERTTFGGADGSKLMLGDAGIFLRLANPSEKIDTESSQSRFGYHHIGVGVTDLDAAYGELKAKGVVFSVSPKQTSNGSVAFIKGPDGIIVELYQPQVQTHS